MKTAEMSILNNYVSKARKVLEEPDLSDREREYWRGRLAMLLWRLDR